MNLRLVSRPQLHTAYLKLFANRLKELGSPKDSYLRMSLDTYKKKGKKQYNFYTSTAVGLPDPGLYPVELLEGLVVAMLILVAIKQSGENL